MTTVSARIDEDLKRQMEEYDIDTSKLLRAAIEDEIRRRRREKLKEQGKQVSQMLQESGVTSEEFTEAIREDRDADLEDR